MQEVVVTCGAFTYGGQTLARLADGRAVFIPFTLPGERVRIRLVKEKVGYVEAALLEILTPAPERIAPCCPHYMHCGGCHYQHLDYPDQLAAKTQILRDQLTRLGGLVDPPVGSAVPSPQPWHYRNHMQFHRLADGRLGLQAAHSQQSIAIQACYLPEPGLDGAWRLYETSTPSFQGRQAGKQGNREARRRSTVGQEVGPERISLRVGKDGAIQTAQSPALLIQVLDRTFRVSAASFFQVNTQMAEQMVQHLLRHLSLSKQTVALDVYCGVGLFSAFLAPRVKHLISIESSASACADFAVNLAGADNVTLQQVSAEHALAQVRSPVDVLVADPPRAGLGKTVVEQILRLMPTTVAYVSCDPATLARDARQLVAGGYQLQHITPFDLFPQTYHIESVSLWAKA